MCAGRFTGSVRRDRSSTPQVPPMLETTHTVTADLGETAVANLMAELAAPVGQDDPYPTYARLRRLGRTVAGPDDALIVTGYRECSALLREPRLRKHPGRLLETSGFPDWRRRPALSLMFERLLMLNPPEHTRVRSHVAGVFTARRVAGMRPAVEAIADQLLDGLPEEFDFVAEIGFPFPVTVIGELLGVPVEDRPMFRGLVDEWATVLEILNPPAVDRADAAAAAIVDYFAELTARRRSDPRDDLLSALAGAGGSGAEPPLTDEEIIRTAALILAAGFETTTGMLGNGLVALLEHPDQADRLRREPDLARPAVDEILRFDAPVQITYGRTAVDDLMVGDVALHAGQRVIAILGAGNRDPGVFTEPDRLILDRDEGIPLSFGAGIHHCLGAALARLEGQVMLPRLLRRFPEARLAGPRRRRAGNTIRGYASLPVVLG
jgi:cytochrome P450